MKTNKIAFAGFMASIMMASGSAMASEEATALTTKGYVDAGLRAVYQTAASKASQSDLSALSETVAGHTTAISALQTAVSGKADASDLTTLANKVNHETTGLNTKASQADLNALQAQVNALDGATYSGINGVTVTDHNIGLNVTATAGKMYAYTSSGWDEIPIESTWDSSVLTQ